MNEDFRQLLINYFRSGMLSSTDKLTAFLFQDFIIRKNAKRIVAQYSSLPVQNPDGVKKEITVRPYTGRNDVALMIKEYLKNHIGTTLIGAYVHGSVATSEEIAYSDFDGIVIVSNECMTDAQKLSDLFSALKETERMMLDMDPLQHHGWFVLTEADLSAYPEYYFPPELFNHAATLYGKEKFAIYLNMEVGSAAFLSSFNKLARSILSKLKGESYVQNYYVFKNLLSEFMLLPAIYLQAKTGKGVFKKDSFEILRKELGDDFSVMDSISEIRRNWNYIPTTGYVESRKRKYFLQNKLAEKSGDVPPEMKNRFNNSLATAMRLFVEELQNRLKR